MKKLFQFGNRYAEESTWKDFALVKLCLGAMGVLIGLCIPAEKKTEARIIAGGVFGTTYALLMRRAIALLKRM